MRRVSQGSGVMMLTDPELDEMAQLGSGHGIEVSLFLGPRGAWDTGGQSFVTSAVGVTARGAAGSRAVPGRGTPGLAHGIRSYLVGDLGVLATLGRLRAAGDLPPDLVLKTSVLLPCANGATARPLEECGATTINVSTDLSVEDLSEIRQAAPLRSTSTSRSRTTRVGSYASTRCPS